MKPVHVRSALIVAGAMISAACAHQETGSNVARLAADEYTLTCTKVEMRANSRHRLENAVYMSQPVRVGDVRAEFEPLYRCSVDRDDVPGDVNGEGRG